MQWQSLSQKSFRHEASIAVDAARSPVREQPATISERRRAAADPARRKLTILISSAGRRVGLMECFRSDAAELDIDLDIIAIDVLPDISPACHLANAAFSVPPCTAQDFVDSVHSICFANAVELVVPTIDPELDVLSRHKSRFAEIGTELALSSPGLVRLASDKLETAHFLAAAGIPVPRTAAFNREIFDAADWKWPLILKPRIGSASRGAMVVNCPEAVPHSQIAEDYIVQEYMRGEEYTVNVFFDRQEQLCCAIPHVRREVRAGEVSKGTTRRHARLERIAHRLAEVLPSPRGALCFQAIATDDERVGIFEINARFGGGFPLAHAAGARFSQWLLQEAAGLPSAANNAWREGVTMLRYDAAVFC
jgi:carbamoyl-phosphate synthase large subunit